MGMYLFKKINDYTSFEEIIIQLIVIIFTASSNFRTQIYSFKNVELIK